MFDISKQFSQFISNKHDIVSKIVKQLKLVTDTGTSRNEMTNYKSADGSKSGTHYYSQSSSQPGVQKTPYNIHQGHNWGSIVKELLEIIIEILKWTMLSPKKFLEKFELRGALLKLNSQCKAEGLVIVEDRTIEILKK